MMLEIFVTAESSIEETLPAEEKRQMDCRKGCSVCCRVNVPVLTSEAVAIKEFIIENHLKTDELIDKMERLITAVGDLDEIERIFVQKECAFLYEDSCIIYPVRPLICRSVTSADAEACRESMTMIALDQTVAVPMNIKQKSIMESAFKILAETLKRYNLPDNSYEITKSVLKQFKP